MNTCMCTGSVGLTDSPSEALSVGTVAPAQQHLALARDVLAEDVDHDLPPFRIARHEHEADRVMAGLGQRDAELGGLPGEERVRDLHQDAGAVAGARIGADRAAMLEIEQDRQRVLDDLVRLAVLDVGDEADAAGVRVVDRIVEADRVRIFGIKGGLLAGLLFGGPPG